MINKIKREESKITRKNKTEKLEKSVENIWYINLRSLEEYVHSGISIKKRELWSKLQMSQLLEQLLEPPSGSA